MFRGCFSPYSTAALSEEHSLSFHTIKELSIYLYYCVVPNTTPQDLQKFSALNKQYKWILVCIDSFSKYVSALPLKNKDNTEVIWGMQKALNKMGIPRVLLSDNGWEFISEQFHQLLFNNNIKPIKIDVYSAAQNGSIERVNQTLKRKLFKYFTLQNTKN